MSPNLEFLAIDFETASPTLHASACAVGWAVVRGGEVASTGGQLIDPGIPKTAWGQVNSRIHGITYAAVLGAPTFLESWNSIIEARETIPLVAHNASFDMSVLRAEFSRAGALLGEWRYACSLLLARAVWPSIGSAALPAVANALGLELRHHDPEADAIASARIVIEAAKELGSRSLPETMRAAGVYWGRIHSTDGWVPCRGSSFLPAGRDLPDQRAAALTRPDPSHPFFGRDIVFTGALDSMSRDQAEQAVTQLGGHPRSSVTKRTAFVIVGGFKQSADLAGAPGTSAKHLRALELRDLGLEVELMSEGDFLVLL